MSSNPKSTSSLGISLTIDTGLVWFVELWLNCFEGARFRLCNVVQGIISIGLGLRGSVVRVGTQNNIIVINLRDFLF